MKDVEVVIPFDPASIPTDDPKYTVEYFRQVNSTLDTPG